MAEYIKRDALMRRLELTPLLENNELRDGVVDLVLKFPAADVVEVRHGEWVLEREPNGKPYCFHCSACDGDFHHIGIKTATDYCPNCGAKMDGKDGAKCVHE